MESIRERTLQIEESTLSSHAMLCKNTKGRQAEQQECEIRTAYQRDRDRIIHSNAFRRLKDKTQVFLAPEGDHYRTRLTHTLEVSQIARTISRGLRLNEDLTEAIALGHDLGHTPFGHAGERALDAVHPGGFKHYEQSLRVVDFLEKNGKGLNLTYEVRDGIVCHTTGTPAQTLEGRVVKIADKIAYINHDIDDAIRAGIFEESDIPKSMTGILGETKSKRISTLVLSTILNSTNDIQMSDDIQAAFYELHSYMFANVYKNPVCKGEEGKAINILQRMYIFFKDNPENMPPDYIDICEKDGSNRAACDYIAGMSDRYALSVYHELFVPQAWT
ncbi:MAG: deoxyguanosinetriphosphate triphosphohydrolase [Clostridia bacterium]|nr:deoxyguanosinetriphosphate triphosphohydrolase [Clostridia bacterium]